MVTPDEEHDQYVKDPRYPCMFGVKCYQKNPLHHEKYKHPPKKPVVSKTVDCPDTLQTKRKLSCDGEDTQNKDLEVSNSAKIPKLVSNSGSIPTSSKEDVVSKPVVKKDSLESLDDKKTFIKEKFLIDMPTDFYKFWDFCKTLDENDPCNALSCADLVLVGPYDVLADKFSTIDEKTSEDYLVHWRYYYDPPEFQTVIKGSDVKQYHIGYFRDEPQDLPVFVASNEASTNGEFSCMGENLFAAVSSYLESYKTTCNPFKKIEVSKLQEQVKSQAEKLNLNLSAKTNSIKSRNNKILARSFNKLGLVVPYNKKTQLGYRELCVSDKELRKLLDRLAGASEQQRSKVMSEIQSVLTATSIATDECDFGTGIELGWNILAHGVELLNLTISRFLSTSYQLLERENFSKIIQAHMKNRKKGSDLSIL